MVRCIQSVFNGPKVVRLEQYTLLAILQVPGCPGLSSHCSADFEKAALEIKAENETNIRFAARPRTMKKAIFQAPETGLGKGAPWILSYLYQS